MNPTPDAVPPASKRLRFRKWTPGDAALAQLLWGDPRVTALIGGPFTPDQVAQRLEREISTDLSDGLQYWPIFEREGGRFVGCCGLRPHQPAQGIHELGFHIRPECAGRGHATEAARAVIGHAFEGLGARALFAGHHPDNAASRHILLRLGFRFSHHAFYPPTGLEHPSFILKPGDAL